MTGGWVTDRFPKIRSGLFIESLNYGNLGVSWYFWRTIFFRRLQRHKNLKDRPTFSQNWISFQNLQRFQRRKVGHFSILVTSPFGRSLPQIEPWLVYKGGIVLRNRILENEKHIPDFDKCIDENKDFLIPTFISSRQFHCKTIRYLKIFKQTVGTYHTPFVRYILKTGVKMTKNFKEKFYHITNKSLISWSVLKLYFNMHI